MATIDQFKANMLGGGARPNQFRVILSFPGAPASSEFLCKAAQLPASTIDDITTFYRGRPVHFAGERSFAPWSITVYNNVSFDVRNSLEAWHDSILNYDATNGDLTLNYQVDLTVEQLDRNDGTLKSYKFFNAYPTAVGPIQLDWDANNQIETFDVEFVFNYFIPSNI